MQLVGVPPSPGLAASRPVERTCRCGSMLRMTSREKVTQRRCGDNCRAAQATWIGDKSAIQVAASQIARIHCRRPCIEVRHSSLVLGTWTASSLAWGARTNPLRSTWAFPGTRPAVRLTVLSPAGKKHPAGTLCGPGWMLYTIFVLYATPHFFASLATPIFAGDWVEKEQGQTSQLLAPQGFSDLSLLSEKPPPTHCGTTD